MIRKPYLVSSLLAVFLLAAAAHPARAAVFTPTKLTDSADGACDSDCSLREAVLAANAADGPDFILLGPGTYQLSLPGAGENLAATGDLDIREDLAIVGRDAFNTILDAGYTDRVLDVLAGVRLELAGVTVRRGFIRSEPGGGIRVAGELALAKSIVTGNRVDLDQGGGIAGVGTESVLILTQSSILENEGYYQGGGIFFDGTIEMVNSTVSGNVVGLYGGGLYATDDAHGTISNSTIAFNQVAGTGEGGGVFVASTPFISIGHPVFENTIVAHNTAPSRNDCSGAANSAGHNLLGDGDGCLDFGNHPGDLEGTTAAPLNPRLLPLNAIGGPTPAHYPETGSPAIGRGAGCEPVDQRGAKRSVGVCEIGSVEVTDECISGGPVLCLNQGRFKVEVTWRTANQSGSGQGVKLTDESGYFTFFDPSNIELTVKVLNGCSLNGHYWVFLSGLTDVGVDLVVTDTASGKFRIYQNPLKQSFKPFLDTIAFPACP